MDSEVPYIAPKGSLDGLCQSCGRALEKEIARGTEADGQASELYCTECYQYGQFTEPGVHMVVMQARLANALAEQGLMRSRAESIAALVGSLRRWRGRIKMRRFVLVMGGLGLLIGLGGFRLLYEAALGERVMLPLGAAALSVGAVLTAVCGGIAVLMKRSDRRALKEYKDTCLQPVNTGKPKRSRVRSRCNSCSELVECPEDWDGSSFTCPMCGNATGLPGASQ